MNHTTAEKILADKTLSKTLEKVLSRQLKLQSEINEIRPAIDDRKQDYADAIEQFSQIRGGGLFFPYLASGAGNGPFVELADGSVKYDLTCGIGVHIMGHGHPLVMQASLRAGLEDVTMQGNLQQNLPSMELCKKLVSMADSERLSHCFLSSSGVMAGENALKMALQKNSPASRVLAFEHCFAGRSLAFSQINDKPAFRQGLPEILDVDYVPFYDPTDPNGSTERAVRILKGHLTRHPGHHAAMIFELIQGEGGFNVGNKMFHRALMEVCHEHKVAVLVDEVQTFCRTHHAFAFQEFGVEDLVDIVWVGKAAQVCATLFTDKYAPKPGLVAQTYTASSGTIAASLAILNELTEGDYFGLEGKSAALHTQFVAGFEDIASRHPDMIKGPYGMAAMTGCTVHGGNQAKVLKLVHLLFERGIIAFLAGANPTRLRFLLPIGALEEAHVKEVLEILETCLLETV